MSDTPVYLGFWVDHSKGAIAGKSWTVTNQAGLYVIAFLALWVRLVGSHLWTIICFIFHQVRASPEAQDGLHHQHQFLLRNSQSNTSTLWDLTKVTWYWRTKTRSFARTFPLLALAITHLVLFTAAAFFSSQIASTSNLVLIKENPACGYLQYPEKFETVEDTRQSIEWFIANKADARWALTYAEECYGQNASTSSTLCNTLVHRTLNVTSSITDCPFPNATTCRDDAVQIDTGYMNSAKHLGVNSQSDDSVDYRSVTTCAPINTQGYYFHDSSENVSVIEGESKYFMEYGLAYSTNTNSTFSFYQSQFAHRNQAYRLYWTQALAGTTTGSNFLPIDSLNRTDGDVTLILVLNLANYAEPVEDSWYKADEPFEDSTGQTRYQAESMATVMGCVQQHEFCLGYPRKCTGLSSIHELEEQPAEAAQQSVTQHLLSTISSTNLLYMFNALGTDALQAKAGLAGEQRLDHRGLPNDQWHNEVLFWGRHAVTTLQRGLQSSVKGPAAVDSPYLQKPDPQLVQLFNPCNSQMVRDPKTYSINVFGLFFTVGFGMFIILLNFTLSTIVSSFQKRKGSPGHRYEQYQLENALQVQRLAYENMHVGHWTSLHDSVPTTRKGEMFGKPIKTGGDDNLALRNFSTTESRAPFYPQSVSPYANSEYSKVSQQDDPYFSSSYKPVHMARDSV